MARAFMRSRLGAAVRVVLLSTAVGAAAPAMAQEGGGTTPAQADPTDSDAAPEQTVVVTGSRIDRAGFQAPTPTTVLGDVELRQGARANVAEVLNDVPQFRASATPTTLATNTQSGSAGADLRGLGGARTLVLLNAHRFVGGGDLNSVPFSVVDRVEIVTGGASAAWGSGAVAGVVNIILKDDMNGVEATGRLGITTRGDGFQHSFGLAGGTEFAGGRGNIMLAGELFDVEEISPATSRRNVGRWGLLANPDFTPTNGQSRLLIVPDVNLAIVSPGGLILNGSLAGQQFNPDGSLSPFVRGGLVSGSQQSGGGGPSNDDVRPLTAPIRRVNLFGRIAYDLTDTVRLSADMRFSNVTNSYDFFPDANYANLNISVDNAFLPEAVRSQLIASGEPGFVMGRFNADFGLIRNYSRRENLQGTVALEGNFGSGWRWDAYYSHGEQHSTSRLGNLRITSNFAEAVDSVVHPATGQPACRVALTNPATACVPINLFGEGAPSAAALRYVLGTIESLTKASLDVGAASLRGEPFSTWAGPVSIAVGAEARRESLSTTVDPLSASGRFSLLNFSPLQGRVSVTEGFGELVLPIARDVPLMRLLELNAAARLSDYSTSGSIWSWKVGATNQVMEGLRLRAVRSRDIRAPSIAELFTVSFLNLFDIFDPVTGRTSRVPRIGGGNPNLQPEIADTFTAGLVFQPDFLRGLSLAADYYQIDIEGAISVIGAQDIVTRCFQGDEALCRQITRNANGDITEVRATAINLAQYSTAGVDVEVSYRLPVSRLAAGAGGNLNLRLLVNYIDKLVTSDGVTRNETVGELGSNVSFGIPRWRATAALTYELADTAIDLRARHVAGGTYNSMQDIANNDVPSRTYFDLGVQRGFSLGAGGPRITLFGNVTNMFDADPPVLPNPVHFDVIGRTFAAGFRAAF